MNIQNSPSKKFNEAFLQSLLSKLILGWCILAGTAACLGQETTQNDDGERIIRTEIADLNVPLLFEATGEPVSLSTKRTIAEDLSRILWPMDTLAFEKLHRERKPVKVQERKSEVRPSHKLVTDKTKVCSTRVSSTFLPELFRKHFGGSVKLEGTQHLLIRREVTRKYRDKIKFRKDHAEMFKKIPAFIQLLESPQNFQKLAANRNVFKQKVYRFSGISLEEGLSTVQEEYAAKDYINIEFPSLLQIGPANEIYAGVEESVIIMTPWMKRKWNREIIMRGLIGAYVNNNWKIAVFPTP